MAKRKKIPAWYQRRMRERGELVGSQLVWMPSDVIALIDRVHARYQALARYVAEVDAVRALDDGSVDPSYSDPLGTEWRDAWAEQYRAWLDFREAGRGVWGSAWGSTASTAQAFDQELDAWRAAFEERTGLDVQTPRSDTADQGRPGGSLIDFGTGAGVGALIAVGAVIGVVVLASRAR